MTPEQLRAELDAEGWERCAHEALELTWFHPPSLRVVHIAPDNDGAPGFLVICRVHNEHGDPVDGSMLDPMPYVDAVRRARAIRREILKESATSTYAEQVALFPEEP